MSLWWRIQWRNKFKPGCVCKFKPGGKHCRCYPIPPDPDTSHDFLPIINEGEFLVHYYNGLGQFTKTAITKTENFGQVPSKLSRPESQFRKAVSHIPVEFWGKLSINLKELGLLTKVKFTFVGRITPEKDSQLPPSEKSYYLNQYKQFILSTFHSIAQTKLSAKALENLKHPDSESDYNHFITFFAHKVILLLTHSWDITSPALCIETDHPIVFPPILAHSLNLNRDSDPHSDPEPDHS